MITSATPGRRLFVPPVRLGIYSTTYVGIMVYVGPNSTRVKGVESSCICKLKGECVQAIDDGRNVSLISTDHKELTSGYGSSCGVLPGRVINTGFFKAAECLRIM